MRRLFSPPPADPPRTPAEAAADWAIRRQAGLDAGEAEAFRRWLAADPRHADRLADAEATLARLRRPKELGVAGALLDELRRRQAVRRRNFAAGAATLAVAAALVVALPHFRSAPAAPPTVAADGPATVLPRPDLQVLPDGSVVQLNAGAEYEVRFTPALRRVELARGEALFTVTKDPSRPFVVRAAGVEVRAIGTEFSVRHGQAGIDVLVTAGQVAVARADPSGAPPDGTTPAPEPILVAAGGRVSVPLAAGAERITPAVPVSPGEIDRALAWRNQRIEFSATPLAEAIAQFNRVNHIQFILADPAMSSVQISGIFWKNSPESFARLLEMSLGITAEHPSPERIVLRRNP
ncbi:MAG: FecR domain-containing protein [Opitutaceae bacterium]|nr:FecR domain-containing protein [Opitutaceae bacterium]